MTEDGKSSAGSPDGIEAQVLGVLASIEACDLESLRQTVADEGAEGILLSSLQIVAILVALENVTGVDPEDPNILKQCNPQNLRQLIEFIERVRTSS